MKKILPLTLVLATGSVFADDLGSLKQEFEQMKLQYEKRIQALEDQANEPAQTSSQPQTNAFNPSISLILDGRFGSYQNNPDQYRLPGFTLGEEAGLSQEGFAIGESELTMKANVDQAFLGQMTVSFGNDAGETTTEVEEAFFETLSLGNGFTIRGGRFKSAVGYLNQQHAHAWDFSDAPLVYRALWGGSYGDDGIRVSWIAPTDIFLEMGVEGLAGEHFPTGGKASTGIGAKVAFVNLGGDFDESQSWQAGASYYTADPENRESSLPSGDTPSFSGSSDISGLNAVYKWAPYGNYRQRFFKLQGEYFHRNEKGTVSLSTSGNKTSYTGTQDGYYIEGIYQFMPQWRAGLRYGALSSANRGTDIVGVNVLDEAGLVDHGFNPKNTSIMLEFDASEFSRLRVQFNHDQSYENTDNQVVLQYTMSLGTHGAHTY